MNDDLPIEPTLLAPGVQGGPDRLARALFAPLIGFLGILVLVFYVFFSPTMVDGDSMEPALSHGDRLLMTKSYREPSRGDIVVFYSDSSRNDEDRLLKRVVAVGGDTIEVQGGVATVNGEVETGVFIADPAFPVATGPLTVPEDSVFVLGDNRAVSMDSRQLGSIPLEYVVGKVAFVWAPIHRIRVPR